MTWRGALALAVGACARVPPADAPAPDSPDPTIEALDPATLPQGEAACDAPWLARVVEVSDGDTLHVEKVETGTAYTVRLIGVDTPEIAHNSTETADCWGPEAADYTRRALTDALVWLTFDAGCTDRYERWLAYLHTGAAPEDFYNWRLIRHGQGRPMAVAPNQTFDTMFLEAEAQARAGGEGYWGACEEGS